MTITGRRRRTGLVAAAPALTAITLVLATGCATPTEELTCADYLAESSVERADIVADLYAVHGWSDPADFTVYSAYFAADTYCSAKPPDTPLRDLGDELVRTAEEIGLSPQG